MNLDALIPSPYLPRPAGAPWMVGVAHLGGNTLPYPLSRRDVEADTAWALKVYAEMGIEAGGTVHLIGDGVHETSWWPFENAAMRLHAPWIQSEASAFDAARADMILRRFRLQAALGLSDAILDYLLDQGRDLAGLLGRVRVVAATPAAADRLAPLGIRCWRVAQIGPLLTFEPPEGGGLRFDASEWHIDAPAGELRLTSLGPRAAPFAAIGTGIRGRIEAAGGQAPRLYLE